MDALLIGAGGHAKAIVESLAAQKLSLIAYIDPRSADWLTVRHLVSEERYEGPACAAIIGFGGVTPQQLKRRFDVTAAWADRGFSLPSVVHPAAVVSASARIGDAAQILAGAIVQPGAVVGRGVIVNSGAIVEHDALIEKGAHIAPGAVILGGAKVGSYCMVGARAVVLPGNVLPDNSLLPANSLSRGAR